jgi:tetratricopeptide (TPR) repeat protein
MRAFLILLAPLALAACASGMSKKECLYADWRAIGYEDGAAGRDAGAIAHRRAACADKARVTPDMEAYLRGRDAGLEEYCRPANGFDFGARGGRYTGACEGLNEAAFVTSYERGFALFGYATQLDAARAALANAHADLDRIDHDIAAHEAAIISPATPHPARIDHLAALKHLHEDRARVRAALPDLARDVEAAEDDLNAYQRALAALDDKGAARPTPARY